MVPELDLSRLCHLGVGVPGKISGAFGQMPVVPHFAEKQVPRCEAMCVPCDYIRDSKALRWGGGPPAGRAGETVCGLASVSGSTNCPPPGQTEDGCRPPATGGWLVPWTWRVEGSALVLRRQTRCSAAAGPPGAFGRGARATSLLSS